MIVVDKIVWSIDVKMIEEVRNTLKEIAATRPVMGRAINFSDGYEIMKAIALATLEDKT